MAQIALSGVIGALSHALDIAEGQRPGHAVRSCLIGMRLAAELDLDAAERSDLFYALLLKDAGCSANAHRMATLFETDDRAAKASAKLVDWTGRRASLLWSLRTAAPGAGLRRRLAVLRALRDEGDVTRSFMEARCDRGAEIARMLFLSEETAAGIRSLDEHWDGRGMPDGLRGEEIPLAARVLCLAQTIEVFHAQGGVKAARAVAKRRRGRWFDPALVDAFLRFCGDARFWARTRGARRFAVGAGGPRDRRRRRSPGPHRRGVRARDRRQVAVHRPPLPARGRDRRRDRRGARFRQPTSASILRRAALLHDIGKLAISNRILDKPES